MSNLFIVFPAGEVFDKAWKSIKERLPEFPWHRCRASENQTILEPEDWTQLKSAERIIIDVTGGAASTLFLAGYAHAMGKAVCLITQTPGNSAFASPCGKVLCYGGDFGFLCSELEKWIGQQSGDKVLSQEGDKTALARFRVLFGDIVEKHHYAGKLEVAMDGDKTFEIREQEMELALVEELVKRARAKGLRLKLL